MEINEEFLNKLTKITTEKTAIKINPRYTLNYISNFTLLLYKYYYDSNLWNGSDKIEFDDNVVKTDFSSALYWFLMSINTLPAEVKANDGTITTPLLDTLKQIVSFYSGLNTDIKPEEFAQGAKELMLLVTTNHETANMKDNRLFNTIDLFTFMLETYSLIIKDANIETIEKDYNNFIDNFKG
jgi:hypothetical protein